MERKARLILVERQVKVIQMKLSGTNSHEIAEAVGLSKTNQVHQMTHAVAKRNGFKGSEELIDYFRKYPEDLKTTVVIMPNNHYRFISISPVPSTSQIGVAFNLSNIMKLRMRAQGCWDDCILINIPTGRLKELIEGFKLHAPTTICMVTGDALYEQTVTLCNQISFNAFIQQTSLEAAAKSRRAKNNLLVIFIPKADSAGEAFELLRHLRHYHPGTSIFIESEAPLSGVVPDMLWKTKENTWLYGFDETNNCGDSTCNSAQENVVFTQASAPA